MNTDSFLTTYSIIDIIFIPFLLYGFYIGFKNGIIKEILSIVGLIASLVFSFLFYKQVSFFILENININNNYSSAIAVIIIFSATFLIGKIISSVFTNIVNTLGLGLFNKIFGGIFCLIKYFLVILIIYFFISQFLNLKNIFSKQIENSIVFSYINYFSELLFPKIF